MLLGQVFVVKDRKAARQVLAKREDHVRAVTLRGEVFHASGPISVDSEGRAAALRRPREQQELGEKLNDVEINLKEVDEKIQKIDELEVFVDLIIFRAHCGAPPNTKKNVVYACIACPRAASAASRSTSLKVGWACTLRAISAGVSALSQSERSSIFPANGLP